MTATPLPLGGVTRPAPLAASGDTNVEAPRDGCGSDGFDHRCPCERRVPASGLDELDHQFAVGP